jgi:cation transport regulator ChaC
MTTDRHFVFAYGSNMDVPDLLRWLRERGHDEREPFDIRRGTLHEHRFAWNYRSPVRKGGAANVEPSAGARVPGLLLEVDEHMLLALDEKEGHPERYLRRELTVHVDGGGHVDAWVYRVTERYLTGDETWPRRAYLDVVLRGAREWELPDWHIEALAKTPTMD